MRSSPLHGDPFGREVLAAGGVLLLCALALLPFSPGTARAQAGVVAGIVTTGVPAAPVAGATIQARGSGGQAVTDSTGRFRIGGLSGTNVMLDVRRLGFRATSVTARVGDTDVRVSLTVQSVRLDEMVVTGTAGARRA